MSHTCSEACASTGCILFRDGLAEVCVCSKRNEGKCPFFKRVLIPCTLYTRYSNMDKNQVETSIGKIELPTNYSSFSRAVVAMALANPEIACACSFCNKKATDIFAYSKFEDLGNKRAKLTLEDDWLCCDDKVCQELAEYNSRRGDEVGIDVGDESVSHVFPGEAEITDELLGSMSTYGPGYGVATDLAPNVCRLDFTKIEVFFAGETDPTTLTIPYKKLVSIDNTIKFPHDWSFDRAKAAGFVGLGEVSGDVIRKYMKDILDSAASKILNHDGGVTCSICYNNVAVGYSMQLAYIPNYNGKKGIFRSTGKEKWTCDSDMCIGKAGRSTFRRQAQLNLIVCNYCGVSDDTTFPRCSVCKKVFYCSKDCQTKDWRAHREYCKAMSKSKGRKNK